MTRTIIAAAAVIAMFSATGPVFAGETGWAPRAVVSYKDLDVSHPAGAQALLDRIEWAAEGVCGGKPDMLNLDLRALYNRCYARAVNTAVSQVNQPLLAELYGKPLLNADAAPNGYGGSQYVAENIGADGDRPSLFERIAKALF
jgi:UrcA family protein